MQLFLETYFVEFLNDDKMCNSTGEKLLPDQENALQTLVRSYLSSLSTPVRSVSAEETWVKSVILP